MHLRLKPVLLVYLHSLRSLTAFAVFIIPGLQVKSMTFLVTFQNNAKFLTSEVDLTKKILGKGVKLCAKF